MPPAFDRLSVTWIKPYRDHAIFSFYRVFQRFLWLLSISFLIHGCTLTTSLLKPKTTTYTEEVSTIWVSPETEMIAILTDKHHYIFEKNASLLTFLNSPLHQKSQASFSQFQLDDDDITGFVWLSLPTDTDEKSALAMGFSKSPYLDAQTATYDKQFPLSGKRYLPSENISQWLAASNPKALHQTYSIRLAETESTNIFALALTPFSVAADGAIFLFNAPVNLYQLKDKKIDWR